MTSGVEEHLASCPFTAAGSRALADQLRDDHGKAACTSPYEDHAAHSAMHAAAHEAGQHEPPPARDTAGRPHAPCGPVSFGTEPGGDGSPGDAGHEHAWACAGPQHATYRCGCGQTAPGSEIGVTEQARGWSCAQPQPARGASA